MNGITWQPALDTAKFGENRLTPKLRHQKILFTRMYTNFDKSSLRAERPKVISRLSCGDYAGNGSQNEIRLSRINESHLG